MTVIKLFSRRLGDAAIVTVYNRRTLLRGIVHAQHGGAPVLKGDSSWRTVAGVIFPFRDSTVLIQVRRWARW